MAAASSGLNARDEKGMMPLHYASRNGNIPLMRQLIANRADVNGQTLRGSTPLHFAIAGLHIEAVRLLVEAKADLMIKNDRDISPFQVVLIHRYLVIEKYQPIREIIWSGIRNHLKRKIESSPLSGRNVTIE